MDHSVRKESPQFVAAAHAVRVRPAEGQRALVGVGAFLRVGDVDVNLPQNQDMCGEVGTHVKPTHLGWLLRAGRACRFGHAGRLFSTGAPGHEKQEERMGLTAIWAIVIVIMKSGGNGHHDHSSLVSAWIGCSAKYRTKTSMA